MNWGATKKEIASFWPVDGLICDPAMRSTRAVTIDVLPEKVWPWLVQMGQGRGGFYSYAWLENLFGLDIHNADQIVPEWQKIEPGDVIPFWQNKRGEKVGVKVLQVEPSSLLVLGGELYPAEETQRGPAGDLKKNGRSSQTGGTWAFMLQAVQENKTRLVVRSQVAKFPPVWLSVLMSRLFIMPVHWVMERKMLLMIKKRAEAAL